MNRFLYELLPYLYMSLGAIVMLTFPALMAQLAAGLLFLAGALVYALRSDHRRTDPERRRKPGFWPFWVYELLPFIWLAAAILLFRDGTNKTQMLLAVVLMTWSIYLLGRRTLHRHHKRA
ncbi:hypothetical protein [Shewanella sedimentimangrovi]|uniref:Amino acid permease-associated region n=1 Tax=Shewanella sedimentimangrovi TaxID=2814293 RepID=A0ABX7R5K0_9GAMM|nr:hypothetical protein [Shewanella sedimentimangrovi]QSX38061.1 hypothetical protein JYB85_04290 [Shewanella sedimentimangrovi]